MTRFKLGKLAPKRDPRTLKLSRYLNHFALPIPQPVDWSVGVNYDMLLNDQIGDCAIAGPAHLVQTWTKCESGAECVVSDSQALSDYINLTGYDPNQTDEQGNNPTDTGCALLDVMKYWRGHGVVGHRIDGFTEVDPHNLLEVRQAISLFGGLVVGIQLPSSAQKQTDNGLPWSLVSGAVNEGGHCVVLVGWNEGGPLCITWGQRQPMTWEFFENRCDEAIVVLSPDWASPSKGLSPSGFNETALQLDLAAFA